MLIADTGPLVAMLNAKDRRHEACTALFRRFRSREEVESSLAACGYRVAEIRDAPDRPGREFVFIAERLPRLLPHPGTA